VDIRISSKEGFNVGTINNEFIILDTKLTEELIEEGIARETISKIQQLRKNNDFNVVDRIKVYYDSDFEYEKALNNNIDFIKNETLAVEFIKDSSDYEVFDINDHQVKIKVEKI
ncbi:MAG: isoleucine--tRNA ligase, partial [Clostridia bacterium]|nr:isoleucine--tRNA ligase [Clostridia bacterium]